MPTAISQRLARSWWDAERFGLTPGKLAARLGWLRGPRVLIVSLPKAGTHLLERALCLHPHLYRRLTPTLSDDNLERFGGLERLLARLRPGQVLVSHLLHSPERSAAVKRAGARCVFAVRDPRDIVVSQAHYAFRTPSHPLHDLFRSKPRLADRVRLAIEGDADAGLTSIGERLRRLGGWREDGAFVVRFEDLVGGAGGGSGATQREVLKRLFAHLGLELDDRLRDELAQRVFSRVSPTFRRGRVEQWRELFERAELDELFRRVVGDEMTRYGYRYD